MKKYLILMVCISFFNCQNGNNNYNEQNHISNNKNLIEIKTKESHNFDDDIAINLIKNFYKEYYNECVKITPENNIEDVLDRYVSLNLRNKIEKLKLDYDPFFNAQDCDENFLKTFKIEKNKIEKSYKITYKNTFSNKNVEVVLFIENTSEGYKINDFKI